jgi:6,7-dimethyl-8-ribityllumazine synthase
MSAMPRVLAGEPAAQSQDRFAVVVARFNRDVTDRLLAGCLKALTDRGAADDRIDVVHVPGAFEIPTTARVLAGSYRYAAVICLGAVIRGETPHFEHVAGQAAAGIAAVGRQTGVPCIFGVLTTDTHAQALQRAGVAPVGRSKAGRGKKAAFAADPAGGNKGYEAGLAALEMADLLRRIRAAEPATVHGRYDGG